MDLDTIKSLSKVTTTIAYQSPVPFALKSLVKEKKMKMDQDTLEKITNQLNSDLCYKACTIGYLGNTMLRHSAQMIYIIDYGELSEEILSAVPNYLKSRIRWADKNHKILKSIQEMVSPISEELEIIWEKKRKKAGVEASSPYGHEHGLCIVNEFLHTLTVALKYNTEADVNLDITKTAVKRIRKQVKSSESLALLSRIEGILNCYQISENIPGMIVKNQSTPENLLKDLLDDAKVISLSESRFLLGIPGKCHIAMIRIKQKLREIISDTRNRKYLAIASKLGNIATKQINVEIPEIEIDQQKRFAPPLVCLHQAKPACLKTNREMPE